MKKSTWLASAIKKEIVHWKNRSGKFPRVVDLCSLFGVSRTTVCAALNLLEQENILTKKRGGGIYLNPSAVSIIETPDESRDFKVMTPMRSREEEISEMIQEDIVSGFYRTHDFLPLQKILAHQYRTQKKTVSLALRILEQRKFIIMNENEKV